MNKCCKNCCYYERCSHIAVCGSYAPKYRSAEEADTEKLIEQEKQAFHIEWASYINNFYN